MIKCFLKLHRTYYLGQRNYVLYKMLFSLKQDIISIIKGRRRMPLKIPFYFYKRFQVQHTFKKHLTSVYFSRNSNIYFIMLNPVSAVLKSKPPQLADRLIRSSIYQDGECLEGLAQLLC